MNIVYAIKIFAALFVVLVAARMVVGNGLRAITLPSDWKAGWIAITGTLAVSCFSATVPLFFVFFSLWVLYVPRLFVGTGSGRLPAYALLACITPQFSTHLGHIGPLGDILALNPLRILAIFLLLPEVMHLVARRTKPRSPSWLVWCDVATFGYFVYWIVNIYGRAAPSVLARESIGLALDTILPYYALTRACVDRELRHRVLAMILVGAAYEAFVGMAEALSRHFLYSQFQYLYGFRWSLLEGLTRGSLIRAQAAFPGPLPLAVLMLFSIGVWFALKPETKSRAYNLLGFALLGGLLATLSRGPVLSLLVLGGGVLLLRHVTQKKFLVAGVVLAIVAAVGWSAGLGTVVVSLVNGVTGADETADFNVAYREELLSTSLALIRQSPLWGVPNYLQSMENLRQGEGIIDLVNTYLVVALNVGLVGLAMFLAPFGIGLWKQASSPLAASGAVNREGAAWLPLTLAIMVVVFTVSPVSMVQPILIWVVAFALARLQEQMPALPRASASMNPAKPVESVPLNP
jgi:hypothetical protein